MLDNKEQVFLLDVRDQHEKDFVDIGGLLIPLHKLMERLSEIEPEKNNPVIIYCRSGARSAKACRMLHSEGFSNVKNLRGGILKWSDDIDPDLPKY